MRKGLQITRNIPSASLSGELVSCLMCNVSKQKGAVAPTGSPPCCRFWQEGGVRGGFLFETFEVRQDTSHRLLHAAGDFVEATYQALISSIFGTSIDFFNSNYQLYKRS
jgi:hypothetical protein